MSQIAIKDYYESLARVERRLFRLEVCHVVGIEYSSFRYRMRNNKWSKLERKAVANIINNKSYEEH